MPLSNSPPLSEDGEDSRSIGEESTNELLDMITAIKTDFVNDNGATIQASKFKSEYWHSPFDQKEGACMMGSVTYPYGIEPEEQEEMIEHTFSSLQMIQSLTPISESEIEPKKIFLQKKTNFSKAIVFDLDETLAHCTFKDEREKRHQSEVFLEIPNKNGGKINVGFNLRKGCREVLQEAGKYFEVIVFTASTKAYADTILDFIDPGNTLIHHRLYRDSCVFEEDQGIYIKDLRIFEDFDLRDIFLVDNAVYSFSYQLDNGVPIIPFRDNKNDDQLEKLIEFIPIIAEKEDVRPRIRANFKMSELLTHDIDSLFKMYTESEEKETDLEDDLN